MVVTVLFNSKLVFNFTLVAIILLSQMYQYLVLSFFITKTIELRL